MIVTFFFSSRRRHARYWRDWSSDVCSSDLVVLEVHLQLVHALQVEGDATSGAVDLEGVVVLAARGEPRGLEGPRSPVLEAGQEGRGVVHRHLSPPAARLLERALLYEDLRGADDLGYRADEEVGEVYDVRPDVAQSARARHLLTETPDKGQLRVEDEVLQVRRPPVPYLAEPSLLDELLR